MPIEPLQLDDRSFEQIFEEAKARIPVHTPQWTNFNESDPGITLVRLFAFMTDNLLYRSNRIPEANRRKFLTLLGIGLQPASAGQGLVSFSNERGPLRSYPFPAGQELRAGKVAFRTRTSVCILPVTAAAFYKQPRNDLDATTRQQYLALYQTFVNQPTEQLTFYQTKQLATPETGKPLPVVDLADTVNGTIDRSLWIALIGPQKVPVNTVRAAIAGQTLTLGIYPALTAGDQVLSPLTSQDNNPVGNPGLIFEIAAPDPTALVNQAKYTRLTLDYADNVLVQPGIVQFRLPEYKQLQTWDFAPEEEGTGDFPPLVEDEALAQRIATWIRIRLPAAQDQVADAARMQLQGLLTWVGTNAARVIQSQLVENEILGTGTGAPDQSYRVANIPVITSVSAAGEVGSTLTLEGQNASDIWETWQLTDDLYAARPDDKVYTLDPESGAIRFGDGLRGMRPPLGKKIRAAYEFGGGPDGLVPIGALNKSAALPGGFQVGNPLSTWGDHEGESVEEGERSISRYLRHRDRLVTVEDFRDITLGTPGVNIGRVEVLPLFNPAKFDPANPSQTWPGTVTVMVIPGSDPLHPNAPVPDRLFLDAVCAWLSPRRLITTEVHVRGPQYVPIWVSVGIVTMAGQMREIVARNVQIALQAYLSPLTGGPSAATGGNAQTLGGTGWPLSTEVRRQDLEAVATRVPGVRYVDAIQLATVPGDGTAVERVPLTGLQLPELIGINVREGTAEDITALLGLQPLVMPTKLIPVPVLPKKC